MSTNPANPAPSKTRRSHTKSRGGCAECKRRKLKCNEAKPICAGCTKREVTCVYSKMVSRAAPSKDAGQESTPRPNALIPTLDPAIGTNGAHSAFQTAISPGALVAGQSPNSAPRGIGQFNMEDMTLWHQFICKTSPTLASPWGNELPSLALNCDYLLHGILALGALHLAYCNQLGPAKQGHYSYVANHHYDLALCPFQQAMANVTAENANQLFAFSTLLLIFNYASNRSPGPAFPFAAAEATEGVSNWLACLRGCSAIFAIAQEYVEAGPMGFLISTGTQMQAALQAGAKPTAEDDNSLTQIKNVVLNNPSVKSSTTDDEMDAYLDAIERLRALLAATTQPLDSILRRAACSIWPTRVSDTFVRLLSEKRPPAMIIMAHYCLLLRGLEDVWYMEHRGLNLFQIVERSLGDEWAIYVEHPRRELTRKSYGR
ncbi:uncharacterized protein PAC_12567 [Phialocephala subalpina]|uniref:Zn(2)-C6 fungal-type domain-containing protein n=1 Tax=Phialocephala subalpina TaxID=576137 RepID=A0A1L7XCA1_9HELO|nr:uncharacterized protein PAC_12567 [Phialocephala subalpina]